MYSIRLTYPEYRTIQMAAMGKTAEKNHLHAIISAKKTMERPRRIRRLHPRQREDEVSKLTTEESI